MVFANAVQRIPRQKMLVLCALTGALLYPGVLYLFYLCNSAFVAGNSVALIGSVFFLFCAVLVPLVSLHISINYFSNAPGTKEELHLKQILLLPSMSPPLYTCIGVVLYIIGWDIEIATWAFIWCALILAVALMPAPRAGLTETFEGSRLRVAHGVVALLLVFGFILPHLLNHLSALHSVGLHKSVMDALRLWYRQPVVEAVIVCLFIFQLVSGVMLLARKMRRSSSTFDVLQTGSGLYLGVFLSSHLMAVFFLGRAMLNIDTNWDFASGAPVGLLLDPWNVRLIPHYGIAVLALFVHLACGLRVVALAHGHRINTVKPVVVLLLVAGALVALATQLALNGVHFYSA